MPADRTIKPAWHAVVRANHAKTLGLVAARTGTCLKIQREEQELVPGREFKPVHPGSLSAIEFGDSWFLGVLLCPEDSTEGLSAWARQLPKTALWRIRFYYVPGTRLAKVLAAWSSAGLPDTPKFRVEDFSSFHKLFGRHQADVVYQDSTGGKLDAS